MVLVPAHPLRRGRIDEAFVEDADTARGSGWHVGIVDIDELAAGDPSRAVGSLPAAAGSALYRGWMLSSSTYASLDRTLRARGVTLTTNPDQYRAAHEFPGWYGTFRDYTAPSVWTTRPDPVLLADIARSLPAGPGFLKDWVKSMKHYWNEAAYVPNVDDPDDVRRVATRFADLRGAELVGGFVLRAFEEYRQEEYRSWWVNGVCVGVSAHPDTPGNMPPANLHVDVLAGPVSQLGSPFVTVDIAVSVDGGWRVVEVGDGQVSDRPATLSADELWRWLDEGLPPG